MKKILSLLFFVAIAVFANAQEEKKIQLYGGMQGENLVIKFKNNQGEGATTICSCSFQLTFPEGIGVKPKGKKYEYEEGDATADFTYSVAFKNDKYTIAIYDGEFDETDGKHTLISLPLVGELSGVVKVSTINFADEDGNSIYRYPAEATEEIDLATAINSISAEQTKSGAIYNMAGQRVSKANKGIYVVDGKKVAVK
jgi:hypothetical protein